MQLPENPCHDTIHCNNWDFCRKCAPEFSLDVLERYTRKARQTETAYREAVAEAKGEIVEAHHQADEANEKFQDALHGLAQRCSKCGQLLPEQKQE